MNNDEDAAVEAINRSSRIRALNDLLRTTGKGGRIMVTRGLSERGRSYLQRVISVMRGFAAFNDDNDPYGEHDFGALELDGDTVFFKIDYYDSTLSAGADDPADPEKCTRVLTLMDASEY